MATEKSTGDGGEGAESGDGDDVVAAGGGVEVIPKEIGVGINGGDALGARVHIGERVLGGRCDDLIEERENVELDETQVLAAVDVTQNERPSERSRL